MWPYFLTYKCHHLSTLTSSCDTLYGKHILLLPSAPFLGPCGQIDRSKKEQRDLVALNFFTRHDLYSWKSFIDRYFHFFLSETEIIVPNTGGETLNGKTYWHLGLLKWACTHTHKHAHRQTLSDAVRQLVYAEAGFLPGISFHLSSVFRREEGWKRWRRMERRKADEWMLRRKWGWMTKMHAFIIL